MPEPVPLRCLVPAEIVELFAGEDGVAAGRIAAASGADISVSDDDTTPASLTDRIVTIHGAQQVQQAACRLIVERFYDEQKATSDEDLGVFILLVPTAHAVAMSEDGTLNKVMALSGAELSVQDASITGTEDRPVRIVGTLEATVAAASRLRACVQVLAWRAEQGISDAAPENEEGEIVEDADAPGLERQAEQPPYAEPAVRAEGTEPELGGLDVQPEPEQRQPDDELGGPCLAGPPAKEESELDEPEDPKESQGGEAEAAEGKEAMEPAEEQLAPDELAEPDEAEEASPRRDASSRAVEEISSPEPAAGSNLHSPRRSTATVCRCLAPSHAVDLLIGFDGEGAAEVLQKTGAQISVLDEEDVPESLSDQIVVIEGDLQGQVLACRCVVETLFQVQGLSDKEQGLFVMLVPTSRYDAVAEKASALSEQTGADLILEDEIEGLEDHPLQIVGPVLECTTAVYRVLRVLQDVDGDPAADDSPLLEKIQQSSPTVRMWSGRGDGEAKEPSKLSLSHLTAPAPINGAKGKGRQMSLQFAVPAAIAAWIVGRKGQSINAIRAQSGASIDVSKEGARYRVTDIRGAEQALMSAIEMVVEQASTLPDGWTESIRIVLPAGTAGYIIGRRGEAIKELRRSSGAEMDLAQLNAGAEQLLVISGEVEVIVEAAQMVAGRIAEVTGAAPKPRNDTEQLKALLVESDQSEASLTLLLPADAVNRVAQSRLRKLEQQTGSQIEVHVLGGRTSGVHQMTIAGTRSGNALAILHLQEMFAEHLKPGGSAAARMARERAERAERGERLEPAEPKPLPNQKLAPKSVPKPASKPAAKPKPKLRPASVGRPQAPAREPGDGPRIFRSASVGRSAGQQAAKGKGKARVGKGSAVVRRQ
ncbi:PCBP4 [Symbiodinium microadriaticum]|nr:PCBP4 [Symbiodinium microadriaticum]